jgi:hypothetical protein
LASVPRRSEDLLIQHTASPHTRITPFTCFIGARFSSNFSGQIRRSRVLDLSKPKFSIINPHANRFAAAACSRALLFLSRRATQDNKIRVFVNSGFPEQASPSADKTRIKRSLARDVDFNFQLKKYSSPSLSRQCLKLLSYRYIDHCIRTRETGVKRGRRCAAESDDPAPDLLHERREGRVGTEPLTNRRALLLVNER